MPFKLTKQDLARRAAIISDLREAYTTLEAAVAEYNEKIAALAEPVTQALANYNEAVAAAQGFREDIVSQADEDISSKSEKWQEGEKGSAASEWKDEWESADIEELSLDLPAEDGISLDDADAADTLEGLAEESAS